MAAKFQIDDALIRRLAELLQETGLTEIEVAEGDRHVRVARNGGRVVAAAESGPAGPAMPAAASGPAAIDSSHPGAVSSPMVGTIYLAPEPGAVPYVTVGSMVRTGDTMFIIEAMKTMNPVRAPRDGRVGRVLIGNAQPVEYGEVLAMLE